MRISDWSSDVCSSDLQGQKILRHRASAGAAIADPVQLDAELCPGCRPFRQEYGAVRREDIRAAFRHRPIILIIGAALTPRRCSPPRGAAPCRGTARLMDRTSAPRPRANPRRPPPPPPPPPPPHT